MKLWFLTTGQLSAEVQFWGSDPQCWGFHRWPGSVRVPWLGGLACGDAAPTQEAGGGFIFSHSYGGTIWAHLWDEVSLHSTLHHPVHLLNTVPSSINMTKWLFVAKYIPVATIKRKAVSVTWLLDECSQGGWLVSYYSCWWWTSEQNH